MASILWEILFVRPTKLQYIHNNLDIEITFHVQAVSLVLKLFFKSLETFKLVTFKYVMTIIGLLWRKPCCFINLNYYMKKDFVTYKVNISCYIFQ